LGWCPWSESLCGGPLLPQGRARSTTYQHHSSRDTSTLPSWIGTSSIPSLALKNVLRIAQFTTLKQASLSRLAQHSADKNAHDVRVVRMRCRSIIGVGRDSWWNIKGTCQTTSHVTHLRRHTSTDDKIALQHLIFANASSHHPLLSPRPLLSACAENLTTPLNLDCFTLTPTMLTTQHVCKASICSTPLPLSPLAITHLHTSYAFTFIPPSISTLAA
jgi:hypothetical protein